MPGPAGATFYIGGSPCAGKSTIANLLAQRHGRHAFHCDEGADLLPELLHRAGVPSARAVWVVPTLRFQLEHYARRRWAHDYVAACPDPPAAFANWMERDALFAGHVAAEAARLGGRLLVVDGSRPVDDVAGEVARHFGLGAGRLSEQPSP